MALGEGAQRPVPGILRPVVQASGRPRCTSDSGAYCCMPNKTFLVRLTNNAFQQVEAAMVEIHDEHLVFLTDKGRLAALLLLDVVESWNEIGPDPLIGQHRKVQTRRPVPPWMHVQMV